ncbi:hypothetical protein OE88DRAFT_1805440 [Heliocybe sulcata]|uniref:DUF4211 domain-containing protein n=1 Tax=Heliocybe sulcata TaxID=5364 RepID=A0A5C3NCJ4_9AGAM|nr:hypothetical protein OE88DRAFT_1805440 [Heliocybe sulcata]
MPRRKHANPGPATPSKPAKLKQLTLFGSTLSSSPGPSPSPSAPRRKSGKLSSPVHASPVKNAKGQRKGPGLEYESDGSSSSSAVGGIRFEPEIIEVDAGAGSEEDSPRRRPAKKRRVQHVDVTDESDSSPGPAASKPNKTSTKGKEKEIVDASKTEKPKARKYGRLRKVTSDEESEGKRAEDDDEAENQPKRRRLVKGHRPSTPSDAEDDDSLLEEVDTKTIIEDRFRSRSKKSAFQRNLEKMKRKKRGQAVESSEEEELEEEDGIVIPFKEARPDNSHGDDDDSESENTEQDEVDDSFIVEDDSQVVTAELPSEFSMNTFQDLAHHFKIICQLFVHVAVQPPEKRHDYMETALKDEEYFRVPLHIARRKLTGMRDSLVASSVWRPDFKGPLEKYPNLEVVALEVTIPHCDACHLGSRVSTLLGRVSGEPYDKLGFEATFDSDSDSGESDDDEDPSSKVHREFNLGRFCARRTRVFHEFSHWEYATYQTLLCEIDELRATNGKRGFIRVAFAGGVQAPEDLDDADGVMEWLDQRGIVEMEWRRVKDMMARARNLEVASKRGEED